MPTEKPFDHQVGGSHYQGMKIQPTHFIMENAINFCAGNAIKYLCRYKLKGTPLEDLMKAKHYVEMLIEREESNQ